MNFDPTIHYGDMIVALTVAVGGVGVLYQIRNGLIDLGRRLGSVEAQLAKLEDVLISNARLDERLVAQNQRITALEAATRS